MDAIEVNVIVVVVVVVETNETECGNHKTCSAKCSNIALHIVRIHNGLCIVKVLKK